MMNTRWTCQGGAYGHRHPSVATAVLLAALAWMPAWATSGNTCDAVNRMASDQPPVPSIDGAVSVPRSKLYTLPGEDVREGQRHDNGKRQFELTLQPSEGPRVLLAEMTISASSGRARVRWHPPAYGANSVKLRLTGLEAIYAFLLRQDPLLRYELEIAGSKRRLPSQSHGRALAMLAAWRGCAVTSFRSNFPSQSVVDWATVSLRIPRHPVASGKQVVIQAFGADGRAIPDASVVFARGVHLLRRRKLKRHCERSAVQQ